MQREARKTHVRERDGLWWCSFDGQSITYAASGKTKIEAVTNFAKRENFSIRYHKRLLEQLREYKNEH